MAATEFTAPAPTTTDPNTRAGDGFYARALLDHNEDVETHYSGLERLQESPHEAARHFCYDGWVFLGRALPTPDGANLAIKYATYRRSNDGRKSGLYETSENS